MSSSINVPASGYSTTEINNFNFPFNFLPRTHAPSPVRTPEVAKSTKKGYIQALLGFILLALGIVLFILHDDWGTFAVGIGVPFWSSVVYIISGGLTIRMTINSNWTRCHMKATMVMNIFSFLTAATATILLFLDILSSIQRSSSYKSDLLGILASMVFCSFLQIYFASVTAFFAYKFIKMPAPSPPTPQGLFVFPNLFARNAPLATPPAPAGPVEPDMIFSTGVPFPPPPTYSADPPPAYYKVVPGDTTVA
ncbi:membrane-spanning 4-domains subfamily A member 12-like [Lissotriton helveticus]